MNNNQRKGIVKMKIYKKVIACILTLMMFFAQMPVNVFAANQKNNIPLDIVLVLDVSGSMEDPITSTDTTKRIKILKDSINQFIEEFAKNNSKQSDENADHMIYGYFDYDNEGNICVARLYSGVAKTDEEFEIIQHIQKAQIYAIHKHN